MKTKFKFNTLVLMPILILSISCNQEKEEVLLQRTDLTVTVLDQDYNALSKAEVSLFVDQEYTGQTDSNGLCEFTNFPLLPAIIRVCKTDYSNYYDTFSLDLGKSDITCFLYPAQSYSEGFESGHFPLTWEHGGDAHWHISSNEPRSGNYCASVGNIDNYQTSSLISYLEVEHTWKTLSFWYWVSISWDDYFFEFYIDDEIVHEETGALYEWQELRIPISKGIHKLEWKLDKRFNSYTLTTLKIDDIKISE